MRKSRLSWYKQVHLIELLVAGAKARTSASLISVNKTTASYYFHRLRLVTFAHREQAELLNGEVIGKNEYSSHS